ncbi:metallophosphoesterase [Microvirga calopogonii]|uniref:metallophosphoesterase n=1 Tax=Microvirga calopogonii TaxID=2078013 RepID=UPI000E0D79AD|nr:metallophosphoesterase [Microvirga calopogonii]
MRLWILSDLHLEVDPHLAFAVPDADVAVVAGDVHKPAWKAMQWLAEHIAPHMPVVTILGNHEYFSGSVTGCTKRGLAAAAGVDGVHLLHDSEVVIGGVRFVGGTLWTDYSLDADPEPGRQRDMDIAHAMNECGSLMADHVAIHTDDSLTERWQPEHARAAFQRTAAYIDGVLGDGSGVPTVVVTHHAPYPESVDPRYIGSPMNPAFASDLGDMIWDRQPAMWVHGHVHHTTGYMLGGTMIACNPRGYGNENPGFRPDLVLSVSGK